MQRHGKKGKPFFWIIAADGRSKRDGKFLEKLGTYNPTTNPAQIDLNVDETVKWLQNGAQPTDTARAILSYKGALMKNHLAGGVRKGAMTEEQAEEKFNTWLEGKRESIDHKKTNLSSAKDKSKADALAAEKAVNEKRSAAAASKGKTEAPADETAETAAEENETADVADTTTEATETAEVAETETEVAETATEETETAEAEEAPAKEETPVAETQTTEEGKKEA